MKPAKLNLLVGTNAVDNESLSKLAKHSTVYKLEEIDEDHLGSILHMIDALLIFPWPKRLTPENLQKMTRLRFVQSILAGVYHIPFANLNKGSKVSRNAGAYSDEVGEYAWALLLAAAK